MKTGQDHESKRCSVTRRDALKASAAFGAVAAFGSLTSTGANAAAPKKGGNLRLAMGHGATSDSLDPALVSNGFASLLCHTYLSQLTEVNAQGELVGLAAEYVEPISGADVWVCKLRKGIEFHNGKTLTADDVIATLNYHRGEDTKSSAKSIASQIKSMTKDDDHTLTFTLKQGNADFPVVLSARQLGLMPSKDGKVEPQSGVGSGSYMVEEFEPGVRAVLKRNPNYFMDGVGWFETAEMLSILDSTARQNALTTKAVDAIDRVELKTVHLLKQDPNIDVLDVTGTLHYTLPMRTDTQPFDNNDLRLALKHSIDRQEVLDKILKGYGAIGNDHPVSPTNKYFAVDLPQRSYDPDKARFHLKKAGMENLQVELSVADAAFLGAVDAVTLYREHAKKAGIDLVVKRVPNDGYWSDVWMNDPWSVSFWSGRPTEDWAFTDAYAAESNWNETFWKNERFNTLLLLARAELDEDKRRAMYGEMQELLRDEGGAVVPMFANHVMALSDKVAHGTVGGNWDLDGGKAIERWWFAE